MAITTIGGTINSTAVTSNLDYKYGPYSSKQEAYDTLGPNGVDKLAIGLTVGIIEEGSRIREYWFRNDISSVDDLVLKSEGPSAYDIAVEEGYEGTEEQWIASLKGEKGDNAVNPFKGWWPDLATLKAAVTAFPGDYAYVEDASPATTASIYVYDASAESDNFWADSGRDVDTSDVSTFESGEALNEVSIINDLETGGANDVLSAEQGKELGIKFGTNLTLVEESATFSIVENNYIKGSDGTLVSNSSYDVVVIQLGNASHIRFKGIQQVSTSLSGFAFYDSEDNVLCSTAFSIGASALSLKEYNVIVPYSAVKVKISRHKNFNASNYYYNLQYGCNVSDLSTNGLKTLGTSFIVKNQVCSISTALHKASPIYNNDNDCIYIKIPKNSSKVKIVNAELTGSYIFFSSLTPSYSSYLALNTTGDVPNNAILCLHNLSKNLNPSGYDGTYVEFEQKIESSVKKDSELTVTSNGIYSELHTLNNGIFTAFGRGLSIGSDLTVTIINSLTTDLFYIKIPSKVSKLYLHDVVYSGNFYFFSSATPDSSTYLGPSSTEEIPQGAVLALKNIAKSDNPNGYDGTYVTFDSISKFESGEELEQTVIDATHCTNAASNSVAKATDTTQMRSTIGKLLDELKLNVTIYGDTQIGYYINGNTGEVVTSGSGGKYAECSVNNYKKIRFLGVELATASVTGYSFYDSEDNPVASSFNEYISSTSTKEKEYVLDVPTGAVKFRWTVKTVNYDIAPSCYVYGSFDKTITERLDNVENVVKEHELVLRTSTKTILNDFTLNENKFINYNNGAEASSANFDYRLYNVNSSKKYCVSGIVPATYTVCLVAYFNDSTYLGYELYDSTNGINVVDYMLSLPDGCNKIVVNVKKTNTSDDVLKEVTFGEYYNIGELESGSDRVKPLRLSYNSDSNAFSIRSRFDNNNDILVDVGFYPAFNYVRNLLAPQKCFIGSKNLSDVELRSGYGQNIADTIGPVTMDFCGPIYANHGYCTPVVTINNNPMTTADIGSIWHDNVQETRWTTESGYREYEVGNVVGDKVYLLPIIRVIDGHYRRDWVYYSSTSPSTLTPMSGTSITNTLSVASTARYDYQVCQCRNISLYLDGCKISETGDYYGKELILSYEQVCYDPTDVSQWWPTIEYGDIQIIFSRQFIFSSDLGFLSITNNQKMNVLKPFDIGETFVGNPNGRYLGTAPTVPKEIDGYDCYAFIPKLKKVHAGSTGADTPIDFREEFLANDFTHPAVVLYRNSTDLINVDDLPDRIYGYLKDVNENTWWGCAGGHSLNRGTSVNATRLDMVPVNALIGWWNPPVSNKFYSAILRHGNDGTVMTDAYLGMNEGYLCWYVPHNNIHVFYYKSGDKYIVVVHTKGEHIKEEVTLPLWMNGMEVQATIEKTDNITLLDDVVIDGRLHVSSITSSSIGGDYNYIVITIK